MKDIEKPYWKCRCGVKTKILRDSTACDCNDIYEQSWYLLKKGEDDYKVQAEVVMDYIGNDHALVHWIWSQDFFTCETDKGCSSIGDDRITDYLEEAGATQKEVNRVLKIVHREDLWMNNCQCGSYEIDDATGQPVKVADCICSNNNN